MSVNEKSSTHPSNDQPTTDLVQLTKAIAFFLNEGESTVKWTFKPLRPRRGESSDSCVGLRHHCVESIATTRDCARMTRPTGER